MHSIRRSQQELSREECIHILETEGRGVLYFHGTGVDYKIASLKKPSQLGFLRHDCAVGKLLS